MRSSCQADVMDVIPRDGWPWWRHRTMVPLLWDSRSFVRYASSFVRYVRLREICAPPLKSAISCFTPTWIGNNLPWNDKEQVLQRLKDTINSFGNLAYINLKRALWNFTTFIACAKLLLFCNNMKYSSKAKYCINILTWEPIQIEANTEQKYKRSTCQYRNYYWDLLFWYSLVLMCISPVSFTYFQRVRQQYCAK